MAEKYYSFGVRRLGGRLARLAGVGLVLAACGAPPPPRYNPLEGDARPQSPSGIGGGLSGGTSEWQPLGDSPPASGSAAEQPAAPAHSNEGLPPSSSLVRIENGTIWFDTSMYWNATCQPPGDIPQDLARAIVTHFGTGVEAVQAAVVAWSENGRFDPNAMNVNAGGSRDVGYMQINFDIHQQMLHDQFGVTDPEQLFDANTNVAAARIIFDDANGKWTPWYGPTREDIKCNVPH